MSQDPGETALSSQAILWRMLVVAAPIIATQYSLVVMQFVDAWMLGALGSAEPAAITPAGLLIQVLVNFGAGFLTGVITLVAHALGRSDIETGRAYGLIGLQAGACGGALCLGLWPLAPMIFNFFGHQPIVMAYEVSYFKISLISIAPQFIAIAIANYFIGIQRTGVAMIGSLIGMVANVAFNYTFIFGALGVPKFGFVGAAWGTVAASVLQAVIMLAVFRAWWRRTADRHRAPEGGTMIQWRRLINMGVPAGIQGAIDILSWGVLLTLLIGPFGTDDLAAATILIRCMQISFLPSDGFGAALQTMVGESLGRGDVRGARREANLALQIIVAYMVGMGICFYLFRGPIMRFFSDDQAVIGIGLQAMVFVSFFQLFDAFNVTFINALHGAGDTLWPSVVNGILCVAVLLGGGLFVSTCYPQLASLGVWLVSSLYILAQGLSFFLRWQSGRWTKNLEVISSDNFQAYHTT